MAQSGQPLLRCTSCGWSRRGNGRFCPVCGKDLKPVVQQGDPLIGEVINQRYRIMRAIGRGGMGVVYQVEHIVMGKIMAMKLLHANITNRPHAVKRFRQEIKVVSRLSHIHTISVFDCGVTQNNGLFIVMEYLRGLDLERVLQHERMFPCQRAARIARQVCASLSEAHEQGVVHRDVKPANIMLLRERGEFDFVKVLDFGIAKLMEPGEELVTETGLIVGTPFYMAPEQAMGRGDLGPAVDIYSLGVVMYEMVTGRLPFSGETTSDFIQAHLRYDPLPPSLATEHQFIDAEMESLILRAMKKDPAERFSSAHSMKLALDNYIDRWTHARNSALVSFPPQTPAPGAQSSRETQPSPEDEPEGSIRAGGETLTSGGVTVVSPATDDPVAAMDVLEAMESLGGVGPSVPPGLGGPIGTAAVSELPSRAAAPEVGPDGAAEGDAVSGPPQQGQAGKKRSTVHFARDDDPFRRVRTPTEPGFEPEEEASKRQSPFYEEASKGQSPFYEEDPAHLPPARHTEPPTAQLATRADWDAIEARWKWRARLRTFVPVLLLLGGLVWGGQKLWQLQRARHTGLGTRNVPARVESEPNNNPLQATRVRLNTWVKGVLGVRLSRSSSDRDWFRFTLAQERQMSIRLLPPKTIDVELGIYKLRKTRRGSKVVHSPQELLAVNNGARGAEERIPSYLFQGKGTYFVLVRELVVMGEAPQENRGPYRLRIAEEKMPAHHELEPNDQFALAMPIQVGVSYTGYHDRKQDTDFFRFTLPKARRSRSRYRLRFTHVKDIRPNLLILNQEGQPIRTSRRVFRMKKRVPRRKGEKKRSKRYKRVLVTELRFSGQGEFRFRVHVGPHFDYETSYHLQLTRR